MFFSVVIPVYNKERYISKTIDSVLKQTHKDFELILVIDPCTDNTLSVVESYSDDRIRILKRDTPGPGGYAARNLGIKNAQYDWVVLLDADDWWHEKHLEIFNTHLPAYENINVACTGFATVRPDKIRPNNYYLANIDRNAFVFFLEDFLISIPICSFNIAVKKHSIINCGAFPENGVKRGGDRDTWLRLFIQEKKALFIPECTAFYNCNVEGSVVKTTSVDTYNHPVRITVNGLLQDYTLSKNEKKLLKLYSNKNIISGIKERVKNGNLTPSDANALYFINSKKYIFYLFFSYLPRQLQKTLGKLVNIYASHTNPFSK